MSDSISISVVIPCYNSADFISATVESVLNQTRQAYEIIIVDDGSTDDSAALIRNKYPQIKLIKQANSGPSVARNVGVEHSSGNWIAFLDSDDSWYSTRLSILTDWAKNACNGIACIYNDMEIRHINGSKKIQAMPLDTVQEKYNIKLLQDWIVNPSCLLVRASIAKKYGFQERVHRGEDAEYLVDIRSAGDFIHIPMPLTIYNKREGSLTDTSYHGYESIENHLKFVRARPSLYSDCDKNDLYCAFDKLILDMHSFAYWKRDYPLVHKCRSLHAKINTGALCDPLLSAPLRNIWMIRLKDYIDKIIASFRSVEK